MEIQGFVEDNVPIGKDVFKCTLDIGFIPGDILPGQFIQISCPGKNLTFLRRPLSVSGFIPPILTVLYKVVGYGTQNLSELKKGQKVDLILPLGRGFSKPAPHQEVLLFGGGIGIAPLLYYIDYYHTIMPSLTFNLYYGVSREDEKIEITLPDPFPGNIVYHIDWREGQYNGNLLDCFQTVPTESFDLSIACGPISMMKAFSNHMQERNLPLEVSLESRMACGFGVCLGCSIQTFDGSKTVCADGPVFDSNQIDWTKVWTT